MEVAKGVIEAIKQREKNFSLKVGDDWFGGYGKTDLTKGTSVSIEYEISGQFKNIKSLKVETEAKKESGGGYLLGQAFNLAAKKQFAYISKSGTPFDWDLFANDTEQFYTAMKSIGGGMK